MVEPISIGLIILGATALYKMIKGPKKVATPASTGTSPGHKPAPGARAPLPPSPHTPIDAALARQLAPGVARDLERYLGFYDLGGLMAFKNAAGLRTANGEVNPVYAGTTAGALVAYGVAKPPRPLPSKQPAALVPYVAPVQRADAVLQSEAEAKLAQWAKNAADRAKMRGAGVSGYRVGAASAEDSGVDIAKGILGAIPFVGAALGAISGALKLIPVLSDAGPGNAKDFKIAYRDWKQTLAVLDRLAAGIGPDGRTTEYGPRPELRVRGTDRVFRMIRGLPDREWLKKGADKEWFTPIGMIALPWGGAVWPPDNPAGIWTDPALNDARRSAGWPRMTPAGALRYDGTTGTNGRLMVSEDVPEFYPTAFKYLRPFLLPEWNFGDDWNVPGGPAQGEGAFGGAGAYPGGFPGPSTNVVTFFGLGSGSTHYYPVDKLLTPYGAMPGLRWVGWTTNTVERNGMEETDNLHSPDAIATMIGADPNIKTLVLETADEAINDPWKYLPLDPAETTARYKLLNGYSQPESVDKAVLSALEVEYHSLGPVGFLADKLPPMTEARLLAIAEMIRTAGSKYDHGLVALYQQAMHLPMTGVIDGYTREFVNPTNAQFSGTAEQMLAAVRALPPGSTNIVVRQYQSYMGLPPSGVLDAATLAFIDPAHAAADQAARAAEAQVAEPDNEAKRLGLSRDGPEAQRAISLARGIISRDPAKLKEAQRMAPVGSPMAHLVELALNGPNVDAESTQSLTPDQLLQALLHMAPGSANDTVRQYQQVMNLPVTGVLDATTLAFIGVGGGVVAPSRVAKVAQPPVQVVPQSAQARYNDLEVQWIAQGRPQSGPLLAQLQAAGLQAQYNAAENEWLAQGQPQTGVLLENLQAIGARLRAVQPAQVAVSPPVAAQESAQARYNDLEAQWIAQGRPQSGPLLTQLQTAGLQAQYNNIENAWIAQGQPQTGALLDQLQAVGRQLATALGR